MRITLWELCVMLFVCQQCLSVLALGQMYRCLSTYSDTCRELDELSCNDHEHCQYSESRCWRCCDQVVTQRYNYRVVDPNETDPNDASSPYNSYLEAQETCETIPGCTWGRTIEIYEEQGQTPFSSSYYFSKYAPGMDEDDHGCYGMVDQCKQQERLSKVDTCEGDSIAVSWPQHISDGYLAIFIGGVAFCLFCICFCVLAVVRRSRRRHVAADKLAQNQTALRVTAGGRSRKRNSVGSHGSSNRGRSARSGRSLKASFHSEI